MPLHDVNYQHWTGTHLGIWARRWVIARNGLAACLNNKAIRNFVVLCWMLALTMSGVLFMVGQLLVADSVVVQWVGKLNPQLQSFAQMLTQWLEDHPEISVATTQNVLFYFFSTYLMPISIFVLGLAMPSLITRDLASNAILVYSSKAVTRGDYLLGKFCTAFGLLTMTWLGPECAAWFLGNLLGPDWRFFWHARAALWHGLVFTLSSMVILSALALGVSAASSREKATPAIWFMWWILGGVIQPIALNARPWLSHLSFSYNLRQIGLSTFGLGDNLKTAQDSVPILGQMLSKISTPTRDALSHATLGGSVVALAVMLAVGAIIIRKRVKPE
jgi:ABC-2 type transport system permease protein